MGFTVAGHNCDGKLETRVNNKADLAAAAELFDKGKKTPIYKGDYSAELIGRLSPRQGESDTEFIRRIQARLADYQKYTQKKPIDYDAFMKNCNRWMRSLLDSLGVGTDVDTWGWDPGHKRPLQNQPFKPR